MTRVDLRAKERKGPGICRRAMKEPTFTGEANGEGIATMEDFRRFHWSAAPTPVLSSTASYENDYSRASLCRICY